jgi:hypothetical protein
VPISSPAPKSAAPRSRKHSRKARN